MASRYRPQRRNPGLHPAFVPPIRSYKHQHVDVLDDDVSDHAEELYRGAGLEDVFEEQRINSAFENPDLFGETYLEIQLGNEIGLMGSDKWIEDNYTHEEKINEDFGFVKERAIRFEKGLENFLSEISGGNLTEGEAREIYTEFFERQERNDFDKEQETVREAA